MADDTAASGSRRVDYHEGARYRRLLADGFLLLPQSLVSKGACLALTITHQQSITMIDGLEMDSGCFSRRNQPVESTFAYVGLATPL